MQKLLIRSVYILLILFLSGSAAQATTWLVRQDGSGKYDNIYDAMGVAVDGDTVLVGPGNYQLHTMLEMRDGVVLTSEEGAAATSLEEVGNEPYIRIYCSNLNSTRTEISGFFIVNETSFYLDHCIGTIVTRNVFYTLRVLS
jgi:hypothetical protein